MLMIWSFWVWIYDDLWAFISVSVFFQQFVCWFILILVHLVRWFESCWCKVHSHRICLSFSICFQSLLEIVAQVRKKNVPQLFAKSCHQKQRIFFSRRSRTLSMRLEGSTQEIAITGFRRCFNNNNSIALIPKTFPRWERTPESVTGAARWTVALPKVRLLASVCHDNVVAYKEACRGKGRGEVYLSVYLSGGGERKEFRCNSKWKLINFIIRR